jgi:hypothetical protein
LLIVIIIVASFLSIPAADLPTSQPGRDDRGCSKPATAAGAAAIIVPT